MFKITRRGALGFASAAGFAAAWPAAAQPFRMQSWPLGTYGICTTPSGDVWWCSLAGSFIARIDVATGNSTVVEPPTKNQGARRVWSDSKGRIWVSEWNSGNLSVHDPAARTWRQWKLPGDNARRHSNALPCRVTAPMCGRSWAAPAKCGYPKAEPSTFGHTHGVTASQHQQNTSRRVGREVVVRTWVRSY